MSSRMDAASIGSSLCMITPRPATGQKRVRGFDFQTRIILSTGALGPIGLRLASTPPWQRLNTHQRTMLPHSARTCVRSEEHTSELQSRGHLVCRLLLEKKKTDNTT